jgi:hypothetical protein
MSPEVLQLRGAVQRLRDRCQHRQQFVEVLGDQPFVAGGGSG